MKQSDTIYLYDVTALSTAQIVKIDRIYSAAERNYESWGHWIVETRAPADVLKLGTVRAAKEVGELLNEREQNCTW